MANMVYEVIGDLYLVVHRARPPSDEEWMDYLRSWKPHDMSRMRTLVFTDGGGPDAAQRKAANDALGGKASLTAVVSPSYVVRGVVTALSWFNPKIRAFGPDEAERAFAHVGMRSEQDIARTWARAQKLRVKLGDESLKSIVTRRAA
jgi:hypothetical protein